MKKLLNNTNIKNGLNQKEIINPSNDENIQKLALRLLEKNEKEIKANKLFGTKNILNMIGAGLVMLTNMYPDNVVKRGKPYLQDPEVYGAWKKFNIPYLKQIIKRLERSKVVEIIEENGHQLINITEKGRLKILKNAINDIKIEEPSFWNGMWWLVIYDLPEDRHNLRDSIRKHLLTLGFFPIQESVYLHAYPCKEQIEFLREFYGVREYLRIFKIDWIENDKEIKEFFNL